MQLLRAANLPSPLAPSSTLPTGRILLYAINSRMSPLRQAKQTERAEQERERSDADRASKSERGTEGVQTGEESDAYCEQEGSISPFRVGRGGGVGVRRLALWRLCHGRARICSEEETNSCKNPFPHLWGTGGTIAAKRNPQTGLLPATCTTWTLQKTFNGNGRHASFAQLTCM